MKFAHAILFALAVIVSGCATQPVHVAEFSGERRISPDDIIAVRLDPASASRIEGVAIGGRTTRDQLCTGEIWQEVFVAHDDASPVLRIDTSELRQSLAGAGFTMRHTYTAHATLTAGGKEYSITARGTRAAAMNGPSAMRQAIELAVVDAAAQCRLLLANNPAP